MKVLNIDSGRDYSSIQILNVTEGKVCFKKNLKGAFINQAKELFMLIQKERPQKIIFDNVGVGIGLTDSFLGITKDFGLKIEKDGTILY